MAHEPYSRIVPGSRDAVVMIHGILGSPDHFSFLLPLVPESWTVHNILLTGHGGRVEDFSRSCMKAWKAQVSALLDDVLANHDRVILVAHSMGTLFSIQEAVRRPEKIAALFLLQVPLRPRLKVSTAVRSTLLACGLELKSARMMARDVSVTLDWRLWKYLGWIPRFLELFSECAATRRILAELTVPCRAYQSRRDELVSNRSAADLLRCGRVEVIQLPDSGHFGHTGVDLQLLQEDFSRLFHTDA